MSRSLAKMIRPGDAACAVRTRCGAARQHRDQQRHEGPETAPPPHPRESTPRGTTEYSALSPAPAYDDGDGARQEEPRPARAPARDGARGGRRQPARLRVAIARERAPRHGVVLRPEQDATSDPAVVKAGVRGKRTIAWAGWGFDAGHRRHNPQALQHPPFTQVWGAGLDSLAEFPPVADDKGVFIETANGNVVALNPKTGKRRWTRQIPPPLATSPALDSHRVYVSSLGGVVLALRRATGKRVWRYPVGARTESSPLLVNGTLYFGAEDGTLTALDARTGHRRWRVRVGGAVKGSPAYSGGLLVVGSYDGHVYGFDARTGAPLAHGGPRPLRRPRAGALLLDADDRLRAGLHRLDRRPRLLARRLHGKIAWTAQTGSYVYAGPAVVHQEILTGSYDGWFYAFNARTGARRWRFKAGARISGSATVVDDVVYFSTFGNGTFGLEVGNGRQVWRRFEGRYSPVVATRDAFY